MKKRNMMRKHIVRPGLVLACALLTTTAWATITSDYDHNVNFANFKTYSWGQLETGNSFWDLRVKNALDSQLAAKGWRQIPSGGDVVVNALGTTGTEQNVHVSWSRLGDSHQGGRFDLGDSRLWGPFGDGTGTRYTYEVGTLVVGMSDARSNLIWWGTLSGALSPNPDKDAKKLDKDVEKMFKHFPPGSSGK